MLQTAGKSGVSAHSSWLQAQPPSSSFDTAEAATSQDTTTSVLSGAVTQAQAPKETFCPLCSGSMGLHTAQCQTVWSTAEEADYRHGQGPKQMRQGASLLSQPASSCPWLLHFTGEPSQLQGFYAVPTGHTALPYAHECRPCRLHHQFLSSLTPSKCSISATLLSLIEHGLLRCRDQVICSLSQRTTAHYGVDREEEPT